MSCRELRVLTPLQAAVLRRLGLRVLGCPNGPFITIAWSLMRCFRVMNALLQDQPADYELEGYVS